MTKTESEIILYLKGCLGYYTDTPHHKDFKKIVENVESIIDKNKENVETESKCQICGKTGKLLLDTPYCYRCYDQFID
jgi:hypothetical protein